jgi:hypothetical protein
MDEMGTPWAPAFSQSTSDAVFGHIPQAVGPDLGQAGILGGHAQSWLRACHQLVVAHAAAVQQLEIKAVGRPSSTTAGGGKAKTMASLNLGEGPHGRPAHIMAQTVTVGPLAQLPVLELYKARPTFWPGRKLNPATARWIPRLPFHFPEIVPHPVQDVLGLLQGGVGRQDGLDIHYALVLVRQVGGGHRWNRYPMAATITRNTIT